MILFSVIYLCERPLSKGHTEGLEVRPACIFKNTVHSATATYWYFKGGYRKHHIKSKDAKPHDALTGVSKAFDQNSQEQEIKSDAEHLSEKRN